MFGIFGHQIGTCSAHVAGLGFLALYCWTYLQFGKFTQNWIQWFLGVFQYREIKGPPIVRLATSFFINAGATVDTQCHFVCQVLFSIFSSTRYSRNLSVVRSTPVIRRDLVFNGTVVTVWLQTFASVGTKLVVFLRLSAVIEQCVDRNKCKCVGRCHQSSIRKNRRSDKPRIGPWKLR